MPLFCAQSTEQLPLTGTSLLEIDLKQYAAGASPLMDPEILIHPHKMLRELEE